LQGLGGGMPLSTQGLRPALIYVAPYRGLVPSDYFIITDKFYISSMERMLPIIRNIEHKNEPKHHF